MVPVCRQGSFFVTMFDFYRKRGYNTFDMKKVFVFLMLFCFAPTIACAFVNKDIATLAVLDKAAGKTKNITIPIGQSVTFEKITIAVRDCKQSDPFKPENFYAFVEISKSDSGKFFSNWMDRNNPGRDPVQNPDYDVWLLRCE